VASTLTQYHVLHESLMTRRLKPVVPKGLDQLAVRLGVARLRRRVRMQDLEAEVSRIVALAPGLRNKSDAVLDAEIAELKTVFALRRQSQDDIRRSLAYVREVARRETGEEPYPVQILAAIAMSRGAIVEMLTGEGKTLTGSIAAPLIAWQRRRLHVFTVNDYLAQRDAASRAKIYRRCGLSVGAITQETDASARGEIYARDIIYGTPKQIVADWLRDQIRLGQERTAWGARLGSAADGTGGPIVPGLRAAMVDEADAVLIDEGVVPLIIARSRREDDMAIVYQEACEFARKLDEGPDYELDHARRRARLTPRGEHRLGLFFDDAATRGGQPIWKARKRGEELVRQALVARHCYLRGQQYEILDGKVVIVDEYTGRFLADRSWEHGLHQAVEAKEGVEVTADRETLARLSFQRYFRSYPFLCGMTGTAADATREMEAVYGRPVFVVPTNRPMIREQRATRVFRTQRDKWAAIVESVAEEHAKGRPVLVGTRSISASEHVSRLLDQRGLPHQVLNANFDKEEAEMIARAGKAGAITVATNMAGRGTDIKPDARAIEAGGLHVVLTEVHGAKRIDRQFIGRAGRQGDPGSAQLFASLEDELIRKFAKWPGRLLRDRSSEPELTGRPGAERLVRFAQGRNEARDRSNRATVLRQDDWIDKHLPGVG
jgi:preprotein translocase subunit SecA